MIENKTNETNSLSEPPADPQATFRLMTELYQHWGVQAVVVTDPVRQREQVDLGFRKRMHLPYHDDMHEKLQGAWIQEHMLYLYTDEFEMSYALFSLSPALCKAISLPMEPRSGNNGGTASSSAPNVSWKPAFSPVLCIGPILFREMNAAGIAAVMTRRGLHPQQEKDLTEHYNRIPLFGFRELFVHTLLFFLHRLTAENILFREISYGEEAWNFAAPEGADYTIPEQPEVALHAIEERYSAETALMEAVAAGNTSEAARRYQHFVSYRLTPRTFSAIRDRKNILFVLNTLLRKSVQLGGVHPFHIDNLSRIFSIQIEAALIVEQLDQLAARMVRKYCILVQNYARRNYSKLVQRCMNHIDFYYSSELSLSDLAEECGVSESYLSTSFRKETGMTVTDCISRTRIRQALILLNTTDLSIGEVAARCGFPDANYFSRIFRRQQGMSPTKYRDMVRNKL